MSMRLKTETRMKSSLHLKISLKPLSAHITKSKHERNWLLLSGSIVDIAEDKDLNPGFARFSVVGVVKSDLGKSITNTFAPGQKASQASEQYRWWRIVQD